MDAMVGLLDGPRARGAFLLRTILDPPWALRIRDRAPPCPTTALPHLVVLSVDSPLIPLLNEEIARGEPGQEAVLDRLLDLLLISVLRAWFARPDTEVPAWYRANGDPVVGKALRMLHNNPGRP